nr:peptidyl-prolyl cis-trans isomerase D [Raoultella sp. NCTC 9187]
MTSTRVKLGLSVSDAQVKQAIFQTQAFQTNGKFDNERFGGIVNQMGMTTDQYAQALRNQLTTQQLINAVCRHRLHAAGRIRPAGGAGFSAARGA